MTVNHTLEGEDEPTWRAILVASEDELERGGVTSSTDVEISGIRLRIDVIFEPDPYEER